MSVVDCEKMAGEKSSCCVCGLTQNIYWTKHTAGTSRVIPAL